MNPAALKVDDQPYTPDSEQELISNSSVNDAVIEEQGDPIAFAMSSLGILVLIFAVVITWCNEQKLVKIVRFITEAKKECRNIDADKPRDGDDFYLVHANGIAENREEIGDAAFGVSAANSYRLFRKVEMLQWVEQIESVSITGEVQLAYTYDQQWLDHPVDSSRFAKPHQDHQNPKMSWPFKSQTFEAQNVQLGEFRLTTDQIARLGSKTETQLWDKEGLNVIESTRGTMEFEGFPAFELSNEYFYSSATQATSAPHVGQYRVSFHYSPCGPATIIAQQIVDEESDNFTFRKWNQEKRNVPYGQNVVPDDSVGVSHPALCYMSTCVNHCFDFLIQPVIDLVSEEDIKPEQYFNQKEANMKQTDGYLRALGVVLQILGFFLLFYPISDEVKMVKVLMWAFHANEVVSILLYALLLGATLSVFIIATTWFKQKPLLGTTLYIIVAISTYLLLCVQWDRKIGPGYLMVVIGKTFGSN